MRKAENFLVPRQQGQVNALVSVTELEISDDLRSGGVFGADRRLSTNEHAVSLVEVRRAGHVGRNHRIATPDTINLDGQQYGHAYLF